ncbi:MAG: ATP-binding protein [Firmicutes bacterium]|nr:ATP-binding protein [Bacillota bacterium]
MSNADCEIKNASDAIDTESQKITPNNLCEIYRNILGCLRNLNDWCAYKILTERYDEKDIKNIAKAAEKLSHKNDRDIQFMGVFNKYLQASISHFTPDKDGAERLMSKYFVSLVKLKKLMKKIFGMDILMQIKNLSPKVDEQTQNYYDEVVKVILRHKTSIPQSMSVQDEKNWFDNYYICKITPFFANNSLYYEIVFEQATDKSHEKFRRITAFTEQDIMDNYCVALHFEPKSISAFETKISVNIITQWRVSIRPCELVNFAKLLNIGEMNIERKESEYHKLMRELTTNHWTLVDVVDMNESEYGSLKKRVGITPKIMRILDECRYQIALNNGYENRLRYLLCRMRNVVIKDQRGDGVSLPICKESYGFETKPYAYHLRGHYTNLYDLYECINIKGHECELLARSVMNAPTQQGYIFVALEELKRFGDRESIERQIKEYNDKIVNKHKPDAEIAMMGDKVYYKKYASEVVKILENIQQKIGCRHPLADEYSNERVEDYKFAVEYIDDCGKEKILKSTFAQSQIEFVYGAAGTGKSTLIKYIAGLARDKKKIFIANTNAAKQNLQRKIINDDNDIFVR